MSAARSPERTVRAENGGEIRATLAHGRIYLAVRPAGARSWQTLPVALAEADALQDGLAELIELHSAPAPEAF